MSMSKKDYEMVAQALGEALGMRLDLPQDSASAALERAAVWDCIRNLTIAFIYSNSRFDAVKFQDRVKEIAEAKRDSLRKEARHIESGCNLTQADFGDNEVCPDGGIKAWHHA